MYPKNRDKCNTIKMLRVCVKQYFLQIVLIAALIFPYFCWP